MGVARWWSSRHPADTRLKLGNTESLQTSTLQAMSEEQLKAFLEAVKTDAGLQEKLKTAASPEAAIEIAKAAGFSITPADIQSMQSATAELSDEELEGVAGGFFGSLSTIKFEDVCY